MGEKIIAAILSSALILIILQDAFEVAVLPRRATRRIRLTKIFYRSTWIPWSAIARRMRPGKRRETYLSFYGPLSLLMLLIVWALGLILSFGTLQWALGSPMIGAERVVSFGNLLYLSGVTFFTLGYGDLVPLTPLGRALLVIEAGTGLGFLAIVIGYLPVIYQAFSRREVTISMLDARAGSPPSAAELLRRHTRNNILNTEELNQLLLDWERWSAELLESHLSYPVLCFYRSQHDNQSWLASLTAILDASALVIIGIDGISTRQAQLTFAMARHTAADLAQIFNTPPSLGDSDRLPPSELKRLRETLASSGILLREGKAAEEKLSELRQMYEPYINALADYLFIPLPPWIVSASSIDNWKTSAWGRISTGVTLSILEEQDDEHTW